MKIHSAAALLLGLALGRLWAASSSSAQAATQAESTSSCPWPAHLDAVSAAPKSHRVILENERVRVLDVTIEPGEREPVHTHCWPSVLHQVYGRITRTYDGEGRVTREVKVAPDASEFPKTYWLEPTPPHAVENLDSGPTRLLRVEVKPCKP
jgi:hypothetical protein